MEIKMKILYVASEGAPYAASGGLGDVMGALPAAIRNADESIVTEVILPYYNTVKDEFKKEFEKVTDISFKLSWRSTGATVYKHTKDGVNYYFVENHQYFDRNRLYGEHDDAERFAFFSMAVVEYILASGNIPDILHANDWQTALAVIYLKTKYAACEALKGIRTLYTIHNIEYQGKYDRAILGDVFALDGEHAGVVEYDGCINLMKGAITVSDYVSTVSPNYANELCHDFFAFGLSDVIRATSGKMGGIINGIDYAYFSPDKGGDICVPFTKSRLKSGKAKNKKLLQEELGLPEAKDTPLLVMITRLTAGKGVDLVLRIIEELLCADVQFAILGTGDKVYEEAFAALEEKYPNFKALIKFDRALSKRMYASADIFVMPSKSEPCGLAQMIACAYGTVPVVRSVGGLYDSIIPYGEENSNGFRFDNYNAHELLFTLKRAVELYRNSDEWDKLTKRAIGTDFSWKKSAAKYIELYTNLSNW